MSSLRVDFQNGVPASLGGVSIQSLKRLPAETQLLVARFEGRRLLILGEVDHSLPSYRELDNELAQQAVTGGLVLCREGLARHREAENRLMRDVFQRDVPSHLVFGIEDPWVYDLDRLVHSRFLFQSFPPYGTTNSYLITKWFDIVYGLLMGLATSPVMERYWEDLPQARGMAHVFDQVDGLRNLYCDIDQTREAFQGLDPKSRTQQLSAAGGLYNPAGWAAISLMLAGNMIGKEGSQYGLIGELLDKFYEVVPKDYPAYVQRFSQEWRTRFWIPHIRDVAKTAPTDLDLWIMAGIGHLSVLEREFSS